MTRYRYRVAGPSDLSQLVDLYLAMEDDALEIWGEAYVPTRPKVMLLVTRILNNPGSVILAAETGEGVIVGALAMTKEELGFCDAERFKDEFFLVDPSHRRSNIAKNLLRWAADVAEREGVVHTPIQITGRRVHALSRLYKRAGYEQIGAVMVRRPRNGR